jgi:hypothetical protein
VDDSFAPQIKDLVDDSVAPQIKNLVDDSFAPQIKDLVDDTGIEPVTPTMSMWCSTAEPIVLLRSYFSYFFLPHPSIGAGGGRNGI